MIAGVAILFHGNAIVSIQSWQIIVIFAPILSCVGKTQMFLIMKGIVWEHATMNTPCYFWAKFFKSDFYRSLIQMESLLFSLFIEELFQALKI